MYKMSEEIAINIVKNIVTNRAGNLCCKQCSCGKKARCVRNKKSCLEIASKTILNLYQKEKDENKELSEELTERICKNVEAEVFEEMRLELKQEKEKNSKIQKYVRSNEWTEDYEKSSCRTKILRILEEE